MSEPFLAEIRLFPFTFAPRGWALCDGQVLPIAQNTALFSLLGTMYGGDGRSNFALPDFQGRAAMSPGQGAGLSLRTIGDSGGSETVTLTDSQMPMHSHSVAATSSAGQTQMPAGAVPAMAADDTYGPPGTKRLVPMDAGNIGFTGGGQPHNNLQPFLVLNFAIALQGIFPSRG